MARRKRTTQARTRRKSTRRAVSRDVPRRVQVLVFVLLVIAAAGVMSVHWLQTPKGRATLVDWGFTDHYAVVQDTLEVELRQALRTFGLHRHLDEGRRSVAAGNRRVLARTWRATCDEPCTLAEVNLEITRAVKRGGGVVRTSVEVGGDPPTLNLDIGSRRVTTHLITIREREPVVPKPGTIDDPDRPRLALVIDDLGYSKSRTVRSILALDLPLTVAILPTLPHSKELVTRARAHGKLPILHLPMEPESEQPEDVGWVKTDMSELEIMDRVHKYLDLTPGVVGVNNHLGSRATQDQRVMAATLRAIKDRDLFFLDSLTSDKSIAYNVAQRLGIPSARNDAFLDADTEDAAVVEARLLELVEVARRQGVAIGIGHPKPWTYEAIARNVERLQNSGVELVFLSDLVE